MKKVVYRYISFCLALVMVLGGPMQIFAQTEQKAKSGSPTSNVNFLEDPMTQVDVEALMNLAMGDIDSDEDGLQDSVERLIGTDIDDPDTDRDGVDDYYEALNGLDPINVDTNYDGMSDFYEIATDDEDNEYDIDLDTDGDGIKNYIDSDNDNDGVRDGIDISPFSTTKHQDEYIFNVETDGDAAFVELQIRPKQFEDEENVLYENSQTYDWPWDIKGSVQDTDMSQKDMKMRPVLEIETDNMPSYDECQKFGIMIDEHKMYVPLTDVYDNGEKVAYSANVFIPSGSTQNELKTKLLWVLETEVDKWPIFSDTATKTYGGKKEYASVGSDTYDIDNNGKLDVVVGAVHSDTGIDGYAYSVWFDMDENGETKDMTAMNVSPVEFTKHSDGGGVAVADLDGSGEPDVLCMAVDSKSGNDQFVYAIGYNMDEDGTIANSSWTSLIYGPSVGGSTEGAGATIADLDGNGKQEIIFMYINDPKGANKFYYQILWNYDEMNAPYDADAWSNPISTPTLGHSAQGGGIDVAYIDHNNIPDLVFSVIDNPEKSNAMWHYVALNINTDENHADAGEYEQFTSKKIFLEDLGYSSQGGSICVADFDENDELDMLFINVDDPEKSNEFWYWVGKNMDSKGSIVDWSDRRKYSGVKSGLRRSIEDEEDIKKGVGTAVADLDDNGIDDIILVWAEYVKSQNRVKLFGCVGWDMDDEGNVRGWSAKDYLYIRGHSTIYGEPKGVAADIVDFNDDGTNDLYMAVLVDDQVYQTVYMDLKVYRNDFKAAYTVEKDVIDLSAEFPADAYDEKIRGLGAVVQDEYGNGNKDFHLAYTKTYAIRTEDGTVMENTNQGLQEKTVVKYKHYLVNSMLTIDGSSDAKYRMNFKTQLIEKETTEPLDQPYFKYEEEFKGNICNGLEMADLNQDDETDVIFVGSDYKGDNVYSQIVYDFKEGVTSTNSISDRSGSYRQYTSNRFKKGIGVAFSDLDDNKNLDGIVMFYNDEEFKYKTSLNMQTSKLPVMKDYGDFKLTGIKVLESNYVNSNLLYFDKKSTESNVNKTLSAYEIFRGFYLMDEDTVDDVIDRLHATEENDGYEIYGIKDNDYGYDHMQEAVVETDKKIKDLLSSGSGDHIPIIIATENNSRSVNMDLLGDSEISNNKFIFDMTDVSYANTRFLQLKWFDAEEDVLNSSEKVLLGLDETWGLGLDDNTFDNAAALLMNWNEGEIALTRVDGQDVLPENKEWDATQIGKLVTKGFGTAANLYSWERQIKYAFKFKRSLVSNSATRSALVKNSKAIFRIQNSSFVGFSDRTRLRHTLGSKNYRILRAKFSSGPKVTLIKNVFKHGGYIADLGVSVYMGVQIAKQFEDKGYGAYAGFVYGALSGLYSTVKYLAPIIAAIKIGATASGVGAIIVGLIELSDFITFLICKKSWSTMMIEAIFKVFVGKSPEVDLDLKQGNQDTEYKYMENGMFVVGSESNYTARFYGYVKDADDDNYDDKSEISENYIKPDIRYVDKSPALTTSNDTDVSSSWSGSNGSYKLKRTYDIDNEIKFKKPAINAKVLSVQNVKTKVKIDKKGGRDYFDYNTEKNEQYLYFDIMPTKMEEFRANFKFLSAYEDGHNNESISESKDRVSGNKLVAFDEDGDGLFYYSNDREMTYDGKIVYSDPEKYDTDEDGIDDYNEYLKGTDPSDADSDNDGLGDFEELLLETDPLNKDTDGDGREDGEEVNGYSITVDFYSSNVEVLVYSNPLMTDTDEDGVDDQWEYWDGTNPASKSSNGEKRWDKNSYNPHIETPIGEINNVPINDAVQLNFNNYYGDLDGDDLIYEVTVGDVDDNGDYEYIYEGGLVRVEVTVDDQRGGVIEDTFFVNDTTAPYVRTSNFASTSKNTDYINGAIDVAGNTNMYLFMNEVINPVTTGTLINKEKMIPTSVQVTMSDGNQTVVVNPSQDMEEDATLYELTIPKLQMRDMNNNISEEDYVASFRTNDTLGPIITSAKVNDVQIQSAPVVGTTDKVTLLYQEDVFGYSGKFNLRFYDGSIIPNPLVEDAYQTCFDKTNISDSAISFSIKQDILLDNTPYKVYGNIHDSYNNYQRESSFSFITGDVNAPQIDLISSANIIPHEDNGKGNGDNKFHLLASNPLELVIVYDENIVLGDTIDNIRLDRRSLNIDNIIGATQDLLAEEADGIALIPDQDYDNVPVTVSVRNGKELVIVPSTTLLPTVQYHLTLPKYGIEDEHGLKLNDYYFFNVTSGTSKVPEVVWSGSKVDGLVSYENKDVFTNVPEIAIVYNQVIQKSTGFGSGDNQVSLVDANGVNYSGYERINEAGGSNPSYVLTYSSYKKLEPDTEYTLTVPAGLIKSPWGTACDTFTKTFTTNQDIEMPGLSTLGAIGTPRVDELIYGHYEYEKYNNTVESISDFQWYRSDTQNEADMVAIPSATGIAYDVKDEDIGKYLFFEITPKIDELSEMLQFVALPPSIAIPIGPVDEAFSRSTEIGTILIVDDSTTVLDVSGSVETEYSVTVSGLTTNVALIAQTIDGKGLVDVSYEDKEIEDFGNNDGVTQTVPLKFGNNIVKINVIDEAGIGFETYTVNIERSLGEEAQVKADSFADIIVRDRYLSELTSTEAIDILEETVVGDVLEGVYYVYDEAERVQGEHLYSWYRSDDEAGTSLTAISQEIEYTLVESDEDKYLFFGFIPVTEYGSQGNSSMSDAFGPINSSTTYEITDMSVKNGQEELIASFAQDTYVYTMSVSDETTHVAIEVIYTAGAEITVNNEQYTSGEKIVLTDSINNRITVEISDGVQVIGTYEIYISKTENEIPVASNVVISYDEVKSILIGSYDTTGTEGTSQYTWYIAESEGATKTVVATGTTSYAIDSNDEDKIAYFEVQPVNIAGDIGSSKMSEGYTVPGETTYIITDISVLNNNAELLSNFDVNKLTYNIEVVNRTDTVTVKVSADDEALITISDAVTNEKELSLSVGTNTIAVKGQDSESNATYTINVKRARPSSSGGSGSNTTQDNNNAEVQAGENAEVDISDKDGKRTTTVGPKKLVVKPPEKEGEKPRAEIIVNNDSDKVVVAIKNDLLKDLKDNEALLNVETGKAKYALPTKEINLEEIAKAFIGDVNQEDIDVEIIIEKPEKDIVDIISDETKEKGLMLVVEPISFELKCKHGEQEVEIKKFSQYVERTIPLPENINPKAVMTAVVLREDGSLEPIPTQIIEIDGIYYAKISSLTNSTYAIVNFDVTFDDMTNHWAKEATEEMGARLIINGVGNGLYEPDRNVTRAEFMTIISKALGLKDIEVKQSYTDLDSTQWFYEFVLTAVNYSLFSGYDNQTIRPNNQITRQEVMVVVSRVLELAGKTETNVSTLADFEDAEQVADWALEATKLCVGEEIIKGSNGELRPNDNMTRAEVATIILRVLKQIELI